MCLELHVYRDLMSLVVTIVNTAADHTILAIGTCTDIYCIYCIQLQKKLLCCKFVYKSLLQNYWYDMAPVVTSTTGALVQPEYTSLALLFFLCI